MELKLTSPVQYVPRVGPSMAGKLRKLGIETVYDLLTYVPFRYDDYSLVSPIGSVQPGETVTVAGTIAHIKTFVTKTGRRLVRAKIADNTGSIDVVWFNQQFLLKVLHEGDRVSLSGKADWFGPTIVMTSPVYEVLHSDNTQDSLHTGRLVPVYSETEGLSSKWLRGRINYVLGECLSQVAERLPEAIVAEEHLMGIREAIRTIHFPGDADSAARARKRLAFEELFILLLRADQQKRLWQTTLKAPVLKLTETERNTFETRLPFTLTEDQERSLGEILTDLSRAVPMNRLLEGDVGAGKTVVAAGAMLACFKSNHSALLMAPTQILAQQHFHTLETILTPHGVPVELIIGGKKSQHKRRTGPRIVVGTHALLSADIPTAVGLIVIDEQQRFGVAQRAKLRTLAHKNRTPHQLIMTATPIPRTLAQTVFGDMDLSVLHSLPSGRTPVKTWVVPNEKRTSAYGWINKELTKSDSQAFVVCPLIDESESLSTVKAATTEYTRLKTRVFPKRSVGLLHGRMKADEKTKVLNEFRNRQYDILVTTPVVEVGIDIPNASVIVIEAAERFGLSQLHQLRGRVGRSTKASYCLLFTENGQEEALRRLKSLETVHDGPELAELDLTLRGPGDLFGTRQHGVSGLILASLTDTELVSRVRTSVAGLTAKDPDLTRFPHLRQLVKHDTIEAVHA